MVRTVQVSEMPQTAVLVAAAAMAMMAPASAPSRSRLAAERSIFLTPAALYEASNSAGER